MYTDNILPYVKGLEDIIDTHGKLENKERFNDFLNNVQQGKEDTIRIVKYTTEGAPIIYDYGQRKIFHTTCTSSEVNKATKKQNMRLKVVCH